MSAPTRSEVALVVITTGLLFALLTPTLQLSLPSKESMNKQRCANNLRLIATAMFLYADDYRGFPHMRSLDEEHSPTDISKVYRTLLRGRYLDDPETLICPSSEDFAEALRPEARDEPARWSWRGALDKDQDPPVERNFELSYTARKRALRSPVSVRSDAILAADKAVREDVRLMCDETPDPGPPATLGNHQDGFNVIFVDGHAAFVPTAETGLMERLDHGHWIFGAEGEPFNPISDGCW